MYQKNFFKIIMILIALLFGFSFAQASVWTNPTNSPIGGNTDKPIDTSISSQIKWGSLDLPTLTAFSGNFGVVSDVFCLNNDNRDLSGGALDLGCVNYWPSGGGGTLNGTGIVNYLAKWTNSTNLIETFIYDNGTNVGISTTTPAYDFDVEGDLNSTQICINGNCKSSWPQPAGNCVYSGKTYSNGAYCAVFTKAYGVEVTSSSYGSSIYTDYMDYIITCQNGGWTSSPWSWIETDGVTKPAVPRCG